MVWEWSAAAGAVVELAVATGTVVGASWRAYYLEQEVRKRRAAREASSAESNALLDALSGDVYTLSGWHAVALPLLASLTMTLLFYYLVDLQWLVWVCSVVAGAFSVAFLVFPMVARRTTPCAVLTAVCMMTWLWTSHWLAVDVIGVGLVVAFVAMVRLPSLRMATVLLVGLLLYDMVFVFFSERIFGSNVMVQVASAPVRNPMHQASETFSWLPVSARELQLPIKLIFPRLAASESGSGYSLLGLGDMALPGLCTAYLLRLRLCSERAAHLFRVAIGGYAVGLALALGFNLVLTLPQPALVYIVPAVMLPTLHAASHTPTEEWRLVWLGPPASPLSLLP
ncbi:hypothetical protein CDCA_CDCA10G3045 [Cyanidium caldarium]|uniref:Uncharacterized protein n=1 Tax=Cyanidium caldarium TaxID=2771 RepID=A0AAV9IXG2_CYACA|nr:hypothetical protein CDCA_CDCA10G3045 [Cyanidium caldarium]